MHDDLRQACATALGVPRSEARARALEFSWAQAAQLFEGHLVPARSGGRPQAPLTNVNKLSPNGSTLS